MSLKPIKSNEVATSNDLDVVIGILGIAVVLITALCFIFFKMRKNRREQNFKSQEMIDILGSQKMFQKALDDGNITVGRPSLQPMSEKPEDILVGKTMTVKELH